MNIVNNNDKVLLEIKDGDSLSLNEIQQLKLNGCSIIRSAHVGNLDAQTLFLAKEGFSIILDEYARGSMRVYRPAYEIKNRKEKLISERDDLAATHLALLEGASCNDECAASYHYKNLISLFQNSIILTSAHLLKQKNFIYNAYKILAQKRPQSFAKIIEENGIVFKFNRCEDRKIYFSDDDGHERIFKISELPALVVSGLEYTKNLLEGKKEKYSTIFILDVDTDVSLITLCDINWNNIESDKKEITAIHFSGLEMINYMIKNKELAEQHSKAMNEVFNLLIHVWSRNPPKRIEILIVPTDSIYSFISETKEEQNILNDVFLANIAIKKMGEEKGTIWKKHQEAISKYVKSLSDNEVATLVKSIKPDNAPYAFIKTLEEVTKKINDGIIIERNILNRIAFNYLLYRNLDDIGIIEIESKINKEKEKIDNVKDVNLASITQYDLKLGKNIFFPDLARSISSKELRIFNRRIRKNENKV